MRFGLAVTVGQGSVWRGMVWHGWAVTVGPAGSGRAGCVAAS